MTVYIIYLYPIPWDRSRYTLKLEKSVIITFPSQNIKPLRRPVGSPINIHFGSHVIPSLRNCALKFKTKRQRYIFPHPVPVPVVNTKPGLNRHYLTFFSLVASIESEWKLAIVIHTSNEPRRRLSTYRYWALFKVFSTFHFKGHS